MGTFPMGVPAEEKRENAEGGPTKVYIDVRATPPRDFMIRKEDGEKHGFTRGVGVALVGLRGWGGRIIRRPVGKGLGSF